MNEVSTQFETFFSKALSDTSRLNTLGYFDTAQRGDSDTYILGYLLVRSIVAAWETTLGKRLVPMRAAALLLSATQATTGDAFPALDLAPEEFRAACQLHMTSWLASLAALSKQAIENFLQPVASDSEGIPVLWEKMIPRNATREECIAARQAWDTDILSPQILRLAGFRPNATDESETESAEVLLTLFRDYVIRNKLLLIGHDKARLFFLQDSDYAGVCPRTYVGKRQPGTSEDVGVACRVIHPGSGPGATVPRKKIECVGCSGVRGLAASSPLESLIWSGFPRDRIKGACPMFASFSVPVTSGYPVGPTPLQTNQKSIPSSRRCYAVAFLTLACSMRSTARLVR